MDEYEPEKEEGARCPVCGSETKAIGWTSEYWGYKKNHIEVSCVNKDCGWIDYGY